VKLALLAALVATAGCGPSLATAAQQAASRPIGEDLIDLLPSGADLVVDVDVAQLDGWPTARKLLALLPAEGRARLARLGADPLAQVEAVALAVYGAGTPEAAAAVVARGTLDWERLRADAGGGEPVDYHGAPVVDPPAGDSLARVTPRVFAFGSKVLVRRVLDVARREDDSLRVSALDQPLRRALGRAPTAKLGRPAMMVALVPTDAVRAALRKAEWTAAVDLEWAALSLAVGDGFDVGVVAGARGSAEAETLAGTMKTRARELKTQATVRLLGLVPYVDPFVVVAREAEIHVAYRLGEARVDQLVTRLQQMQALAGGKAR
jgi:hypothetical protein